MITGQDIANAAIDSGLLGTPYSKLDCQAFVEEVLRDVGLPCNYRGSNHMWRDLVHDRGTEKNNSVPVGSLAFIVKKDGGEVKRGYHDDMGNATHVSIVIDDNRVMESTTGGVQYGKLSRFTNYGLINGVIYEKGGYTNAGEGSTGAYERLIHMIQILRDNVDGLEATINDIYRGA